VSGERDQVQTLDATLFGAVHVTAGDPRTPIAVALDGLDRGYAPLSIEDLPPGAHELRFRAPGSAPWTETFELGVGQTHEVTAHPFTIPPTGTMAVSATLVGEGAAHPLKGAEVYVDGQLRGSTPAEIEMPYGPHSIRVRWHGEQPPVQVIDLPGGNRRIAEFAFDGGDAPIDLVPLDEGPVGLATDRPTVVSALLRGVQDNGLREMWLHARSPEGIWRRYEMTLLRAEDGVVGVAVLPEGLVDRGGGIAWYVSALTQQGDEYFTELRSPRARAAAPRRGSRPQVTTEVTDPAPPVTPNTP
jgi:hypothetical protein